MIRQRKRHRGFSLTEVLMAAGILGVGMTMVASVFPVAVDQSRQSRDATMAALSARSMAAVLRARRAQVLRECREGNQENGSLGQVDPRDVTWAIDYEAMPDVLRCYNPPRFLYPPSDTTMGSPEDRVRTYQQNDSDLWSAGAYTPVVFATPMNTLIASGSEESEGPWRITIAIYKSRGQSPAQELDYTGSEDIPMVSWKDTTGHGQGAAGDYILDYPVGGRGSRENFRGEAYKVSRIFRGRIEEDPIDDSIFPVAALESPEDEDSNVFLADREVEAGARRGGFGDWLSLRGAIAVYHTILGD